MLVLYSQRLCVLLKSNFCEKFGLSFGAKIVEAFINSMDDCIGNWHLHEMAVIPMRILSHESQLLVGILAYNLFQQQVKMLTCLVVYS